MVSPEFDSIEELAFLVSAEDDELSDQGWELLGCLDASVRWQLASHLLSPQRSAWRLATQCLFPAPMAQMRLARFRARCAQLRLLRLREQGIEAPSWAWRLADMAALHAVGRLPEWQYRRLLRETERLREPWYDEWPTEELGDVEVDLEMIPSDLPARCGQPGEVPLDVEPMRTVPEDYRLADCLDFHDRLSAAQRAVAFVLLERSLDEWGDERETIPEPESLEEWALQRRLWEAIVLRSEDGLDVLYGSVPAREPVPLPAPANRPDWCQLSWG